MANHTPSALKTHHFYLCDQSIGQSAIRQRTSLRGRRSPISLLLTLVVLTLFGLSACQPSGPKIVITPPEQDLGQVPQQKLEAVYTIRNTGSQPLKIGKIVTSCDCTTASVDSSEISPGGTTILRVHMDPAKDNLYGKIRRDIVMETNDPRAPKATAIFRVEIQKP